MSLQPKFYNTYIPFSVHEAKDLPIKECHSSTNFMPFLKSFQINSKKICFFVYCLFTCGFWPRYNQVRCAHPSFLVPLHKKPDAARPPPPHANCLPMRWTIHACLCLNPSKNHGLGKNLRTNKAALVKDVDRVNTAYLMLMVLCVYWRDLTNLNCRSGALSSSSLHLSLDSLGAAIKCTLAWDSWSLLKLVFRQSRLCIGQRRRFYSFVSSGFSQFADGCSLFVGLLYCTWRVSAFTEATVILLSGDSLLGMKY